MVLSALRTPVTRCAKGGNAKMYPEELLYQVFKGSVDKSDVNPGIIDDILIGTVLQTLGGQKVSALAAKAAGFPIKTTVNKVNRQCASSAKALTYSASSILTGENQFAIAAGVESITHDYFPHRGIPTRIYQPFRDGTTSEAQNVLMPMGITSKNVANKFGVSREDQDAFALQSHLKATKATESGHLLNEIIPTKARTNNEDELLNIAEVSKDDGVCGSSTLEKLVSLKPVFAEDGTAITGNSSPIYDGASAVIITTRDNAGKIRIKPIARFIGSSVAGVPSDLMGIGPSAAVPQVLNRFKYDINDIDNFELNEAFASQSLYCIDKMGIDHDKVNTYGGAIAIGHTLGATGGRVISTLLNGLRAQNKELGAISMCTSTGQGYAALFANEA